MPLPLLAIGAGMSAVSSGLGIAQGISQMKQGKKDLSALTEPKYEIPAELYKNLSDAEKMEVEGLSAEQKKQFVQNAQRAQQSALKAQADRKGGLMGLQSAMQQEVDAYSNLMSMDAAARQESELRKQQALRSARADIAGAKDKAFGIEDSRYQQGLASAQGMIGAGQQNIMGGIQGIGSGMLQAGAAMYNPGGGSASTGQSSASKGTGGAGGSLNWQPNSMYSTFQQGLGN